MQEMLQTKVKNMHSKEILNLENEFHSNLDRMRVEVHENIETAFKRDITRHKEDIEDRDLQIHELKEIKYQLKDEVENRDNRIYEM